MRKCITCGGALKTRHQLKYCSNQCQFDQKYKLYVSSWKLGKADGNIGISAKNISGHLKRYLLSLSGEKCWLCGWNKKHLLTGRVPLEVDHIDGNSENNTEKNLRLLCPNCHALTSNYKNFNKGNGRKWRSWQQQSKKRHIQLRGV
jgi:HNH endonuclease